MGDVCVRVYRTLQKACGWGDGGGLEGGLCGGVGRQGGTSQGWRTNTTQTFSSVGGRVTEWDWSSKRNSICFKSTWGLQGDSTVHLSFPVLPVPPMS